MTRRLRAAAEHLERRLTAHPTFRTEYREVLRDRAAAQLDTARTVAARKAGIEVDGDVIVGSPYPVLADEAREAQLLVVGSNGRSRLEGLLAGSVDVASPRARPVLWWSCGSAE